MREVIERIHPLDEEAGKKAGRHIDQLTKPLGSLGRLEELAVDLARMTGNPFPSVTPPGVLVFAGDHGVVKEGVSAFPQEVTAQMVLNFLNGGAAINVFSRQIGALLKVYDVGVATDLPYEGLECCKIRYGTANFLHENAMTREEAEKSISVGMEAARQIIEEGVKLIIIGEMGIGNTTSSSAILAALTGDEIEWLVGKGSGVNEQGINLKKQIILKGLEVRKPNGQDPLDVLSKVGGLEIGAMAGAVLGAAAMRIPVLVDGFISTVAALLATRIEPKAANYLIVSHQSQEPGHIHVLRALNKMPLIDLQMRLGEGSGAALAFPIVESATRMIREMATFDSAGVSNI